MGVFGGDTSTVWLGSLPGAMGWGMCWGGCCSSLPYPHPHRRGVAPQACPPSPALLPTEGHPRQGRASTRPSLQAGRSPPTFAMAPARGRGDEMQPHPPTPSSASASRKCMEKFRGEGPGPPRVGHSFPAHRTGREPGPALSPEMKGEGPARPPPQPGGAAGPPGGHRGHRGGLVPD